MSHAADVRRALTEHSEDMLRALETMARLESPSSEPATVVLALEHLAVLLRAEGLRTQLLPGTVTGGALYARPEHRTRGAPVQLVLGHMDTVWPVGTLTDMPVERRGETLVGPGTYDMKAGLVMLVFALRVLRELDLRPTVTPLLLVNADEEIGSHDSSRHVRRLARLADRAFVLEPSLGPTGRLKTARKGIGRFTITVHGRAAHAGLDPENGASAILELSHQIQALFALNDPEAGVSINVGTIDGGLRPNVVAPTSRCVVDVRVPTHEAARRIEATIHGMQPVTPGVRLEITGGVGRPPMERTPASERLWEHARSLGSDLGLDLDHATAGGGSDGNTTSQYTPTLDGLGAVGGGAHAADEHVLVDALVDRAALLVLLLLSPPLETP